MDLQPKEAQDGVKWLVYAGSAALLLSLFLFWVDNSVMGNAAARDRAHNEELRELRLAQSSLPANVTDERQVLPLVLEQQDDAPTTTDHSAH